MSAGCLRVFVIATKYGFCGDDSDGGNKCTRQNDLIQNHGVKAPETHDEAPTLY